MAKADLVCDTLRERLKATGLFLRKSNLQVGDHHVAESNAIIAAARKTRRVLGKLTVERVVDRCMS
jgi:hypothetical protein